MFFRHKVHSLSLANSSIQMREKEYTLQKAGVSRQCIAKRTLVPCKTKKFQAPETPPPAPHPLDTYLDRRPAIYITPWRYQPGVGPMRCCRSIVGNRQIKTCCDHDSTVKKNHRGRGPSFSLSIHRNTFLGRGYIDLLCVCARVCVCVWVCVCWRGRARS